MLFTKCPLLVSDSRVFFAKHSLSQNYSFLTNEEPETLNSSDLFKSSSPIRDEAEAQD